jgi:large subunit ribosomal protein L3
MLGLIGRKLGMTQRFAEDGNVIPVTIVTVGPCTVVQKKTVKKEGYESLQLGYEAKKEKRTTKAMKGHFSKKGLPLQAKLKEFRIEDSAGYEVGEELFVAGFKVGEKVHVQGTSKGRGFQGVMKRWGKHGGPASHGSGFHRSPGSIGMRTWPSRVFKNMKLPGHMGDATITIKNLEVVEIRPEDNLLFLRGAVPGARNGLVVITPVSGDLGTRETLRKAKVVEEVAPEVVEEVQATEEVNAQQQDTETKE